MSLCVRYSNFLIINQKRAQKVTLAYGWALDINILTVDNVIKLFVNEHKYSTY